MQPALFKDQSQFIPAGAGPSLSLPIVFEGLSAAHLPHCLAMALLIPGTNGRHRAARVQVGQQDRVRRDGGTAAELGWHSHKNANYGGRNKVRGVEEPLETANR